MRISDWSSDVCSSDLAELVEAPFFLSAREKEKEDGLSTSSGRTGVAFRCGRYWPKSGSDARAMASRAAARRAPALAWHSRCSSAGSLSATMPAPAWTCIVPPLPTDVLRTMHASLEPSGEQYPPPPAHEPAQPG